MKSFEIFIPNRRLKPQIGAVRLLFETAVGVPRELGEADPTFHRLRMTPLAGAMYHPRVS